LLLASFGGFLALLQNTRRDQEVEGQALGARRRGLSPQGAHLQNFFVLQKKFWRLGA